MKNYSKSSLLFPFIQLNTKAQKTVPSGVTFKKNKRTKIDSNTGEAWEKFLAVPKNVNPNKFFLSKKD